MEFDLANLPWATLLTLASGYSGYYVANIGVRDHHKAIDVTFSALVFGFFGTMVYLFALGWGWNIGFASLGAFLSATVLGGIWSRWGRSALNWILRKTSISHNDDLATAFDALITETRTDATQLSVKVGDDLWLMCDNVAKFANHPNGPFVLGRSGDILMYVTHYRSGEGDYEECSDLTAGNWGTEVTYIPAEKVTRVDIRRKWRGNPTSS
ncbi:MAG TPA: hypothetical protein VGO22_05715 [Pseudorhizobium sp.]|jgi:hypothetical protein|nr:hypothetical protein [Pseudorhizobium sp.]